MDPSSLHLNMIDCHRRCRHRPGHRRNAKKDGPQEVRAINVYQSLGYSYATRYWQYQAQVWGLEGQEFRVERVTSCTCALLPANPIFLNGTPESRRRREGLGGMGSLFDQSVGPNAGRMCL
jgi:hypothetical protein